MKIKKLYRSREHRLIAGVLGGLAEHFDHDPVLWRLAFIVVLFITGLMPFALVYLIAWVLIPQAPIAQQTKHVGSSDNEPAGA